MAPDPTTAAPDPASAGATDSGAGDGSYEICIKVTADGQLSVGVESADAEAQEGGADDDSGYAPAKNIKDALTKALEIFKNNGQMSTTDPDADFQAGFGSQSGASGNQGMQE